MKSTFEAKIHSAVFAAILTEGNGEIRATAKKNYINCSYERIKYQTVIQAAKSSRRKCFKLATIDEFLLERTVFAKSATSDFPIEISHAHKKS